MEPSLLTLSRADLIVCCEELLNNVPPGSDGQLLQVLLRVADEVVQSQPTHARGGMPLPLQHQLLLTPQQAGGCAGIKGNQISEPYASGF